MSRKNQESNWKLIGASEHINYLKREIVYVAEKIRTLDMAVLITGESDRERAYCQSYCRKKRKESNSNKLRSYSNGII